MDLLKLWCSSVGCILEKAAWTELMSQDCGVVVGDAGNTILEGSRNYLFAYSCLDDHGELGGLHKF